MTPAGPPQVAGLLLAAGAGRRFGGPKALVRFGDRLLVERGVDVLRRGGCDPIVVVLGAGASQVLAAADLTPAQVVVNSEWPQGMGSSLRAGLSALHAGAADAVVVALVDQPLVGHQAVLRLRDAWWERRLPAAVASYGGAPRNPVLLDRAVWDDVAAQAMGDQGARGYLEKVREHVVAVACDDTGRPDDVDTPQDLDDLSNRVRQERQCS